MEPSGETSGESFDDKRRGDAVEEDRHDRLTGLQRDDVERLKKLNKQREDTARDLLVQSANCKNTCTALIDYMAVESRVDELIASCQYCDARKVRELSDIKQLLDKCKEEFDEFDFLFQRDKGNANQLYERISMLQRRRTASLDARKWFGTTAGFTLASLCLSVVGASFSPIAIPVCGGAALIGSWYTVKAAGNLEHELSTLNTCTELCKNMPPVEKFESEAVSLTQRIYGEIEKAHRALRRIKNFAGNQAARNEITRSLREIQKAAKESRRKFIELMDTVVIPQYTSSSTKLVV